MDLPSADERLLKALAVAMVDHPRGTFKDIAEAAGISKATLNRFCGTRDKLVEMLWNHGTALLSKVVADAGLEERPVRDALLHLINGHLAHREHLAFLLFNWRPDSVDLPVGEDDWLSYTDALDAFFLRGQREGVFRIDIAAPALSEIFASLIFGLLDGERRGRLARVGMAQLIDTFFMNGAAAFNSAVEEF